MIPFELIIALNYLPLALGTILVAGSTWRVAKWTILDFVWLPLPALVWSLLVIADDGDRSLANLYAELPWLSLGSLACLVLRAWSGRSGTRAFASLSLLGYLAVLTFGTYWWFPALPE